tara:strand:+ start:693 stop:1157 length:465 start_codon:yes stop_codon:yes gene_type:complete
MAYFIFNNDGFITKIAADDVEKNKLNITESVYDIRTVSTEDFNNVRLSLGEARMVDNVPTVVLRSSLPIKPGADGSLNIKNQTELEAAVDLAKQAISPIVEYCTDHPNYSDYVSYKNYLNSFDASSLTYPLTDRSWEEYCDSNLITFYHPLQLP